MKKITLITPLIVALPATVFGAEAQTAIQNLKANGFVDVVYTLNDGTDQYNNGGTGDSSVDKKFAVSGELDLATELNPRTALRIDMDLSTDVSSGIFEQAFVNYSFDQNMQLKTGVFNNRFGFEREDAPDLYQVTHSQLWDIWNDQTSLNGNNLAGLEFSAQVGIVNLIAGLLNDRNDTDEEISIMLGVEVKPMESMDISAGLITADEGTETDGNAGNILDAAITWKADRIMVGGEIMTADEIYDFGMQATANFAFTDSLSGTARIDYVSYEADYDNTTSVTIAALYAVDKNLYANAELRLMQNNDDDASTNSNDYAFVGDGSMLYLELLGTF